MIKSLKLAGLIGAALVASTALTAAPAFAKSSHAGHHMAAPTTTIVQTAIASPVHTTLVAAVKAAGLVETLSSPGPFTVFAPTDAAFAKLPAGTVESLVKPEQKATLTKILTYHVVSGSVTSAQLLRMIRAGHGKAVLTTVSGGKLTARRSGRGIVLIDELGGRARVTGADLMQSNGVIHVTDAVSMPR